MTRDELDRRMVTVVVAEIMHRRHPDLDPAKIMDLTFVSLEVHRLAYGLCLVCAQGAEARQRLWGHG